MKVKWNNCFICLNDLEVSRKLGKVKRSKRAMSENERNHENEHQTKTNLLLQYLLLPKKNNSKYSGVADNVMKLLTDDKAEGGITFCDKCEKKLNIVSELHKQLEIVQMKLVDILKSIKLIVVQCSKSKNEDRQDNSQHVGLELFDEWLKAEEEKFTNGESGGEEQRHGLKNQRKILNALYAFQAAIVENDSEFVDIPRVFLDNSTIFKPELLEEVSTIVVKSEVTEDMQLVGWALDNVVDSPELDPLVEVETKEIILEKKQRKKKGPTNKVDAKKEIDCATKKVKRASSFQASGRISHINRSLKKSKRPQKVESTADYHEIVRKRYIRVPIAFAPKPDSKTKNFYKSSIYYGCRICSYTARSQFTFEHHLRTHEISAVTNGNFTNSQIYHCEKCKNVTFLVEQHYEFHQAGHDGEISILCDFCNVMWDPATLVEHMKTHLDKVFPCPNCSYCSSTREKYLNHVLRCHDRSSTLECDICRQVFAKKCHLLAHYREVHQAIEKLVCGVDGCTKEFLDHVILQGHRKVHKKIHVCPHCEKSFQNSSVLKSHLRTHTGEKPYPCDQCSEAFNHKQNLERHLMSKHGAPKFKCEHCGHEYTSAACLKRHMTIHDGSGFACEHENCGKKFGSKQILKIHMISHSSERKWICEGCGLAFKYAHQLRRHALIHNGEKKFKCQYCGKAFLFEKYLIPHLRIHTGEKPFVCNLCDKAFNQYPALYQHRRHMHPDAPNSSSSVKKEDENIINLKLEPASEFSQRISSK